MALTPREHAEERARTLEALYSAAADCDGAGIDSSSLMADAVKVRTELIAALKAMPRLSGRSVRVRTVRYLLSRGELRRELVRGHLRLDAPEPTCGPHRTGRTVQVVTSNSHASRRPYRWGRGR